MQVVVSTRKMNQDNRGIWVRVQWEAISLWKEQQLFALVGESKQVLGSWDTTVFLVLGADEIHMQVEVNSFLLWTDFAS